MNSGRGCILLLLTIVLLYLKPINSAEFNSNSNGDKVANALAKLNELNVESLRSLYSIISLLINTISLLRVLHEKIPFESDSENCKSLFLLLDSYDEINLEHKLIREKLKSRGVDLLTALDLPSMSKISKLSEAITTDYLYFGITSALDVNFQLIEQVKSLVLKISELGINVSILEHLTTEDIRDILISTIECLAETTVTEVENQSKHTPVLDINVSRSPNQRLGDLDTIDLYGAGATVPPENQDSPENKLESTQSEVKSVNIGGARRKTIKLSGKGPDKKENGGKRGRKKKEQIEGPGTKTVKNSDNEKVSGRKNSNLGCSVGTNASVKPKAAQKDNDNNNLRTSIVSRAEDINLDASGGAKRKTNTRRSRARSRARSRSSSRGSSRRRSVNRDRSHGPDKLPEKQGIYYEGGDQGPILEMILLNLQEAEDYVSDIKKLEDELKEDVDKLAFLFQELKTAYRQVPHGCVSTAAKVQAKVIIDELNDWINLQDLENDDWRYVPLNAKALLNSIPQGAASGKGLSANACKFKDCCKDQRLCKLTTGYCRCESTACECCCIFCQTSRYDSDPESIYQTD
ncbi:putative secreted protein with a cysteine cluster at the C-terminus [Cryptosporidium felis]|nr:putative secreted protein with a cysteine cluster at the C-terminus [Cryptosporidium felis]